MFKTLSHLVFALFVFASVSAMAQQRLKIAVIPKGTTHVFWKSVEAGARQAGQELGVDIEWKGPMKESDRAQQIQIVEQFTTQKVDGIVLAPLDDQALVRPVVNAKAKGIPTIIMDSALKSNDIVSFVATDNYVGGKLAGTQMAKIMGGKGKVVMLKYNVGSASTEEREAGFKKVITENQGMKITVDNQYAGATSSEAKNKALSMRNFLMGANCVFASNESSAVGMLLALRQLKLIGKLKFVGFDSSPTLIDALKKHEIEALVAQNPRKMGYEAVKAMVEHLRGKEVPKRIDTGAAVITRENLNTPEIQQLLK